MSKAKFEKIISKFDGASVAVVGDIILDRYIEGASRRTSAEAPVPVVEVENDYWLLGGAANVANNITALGATAELIGVIGHNKRDLILGLLKDAKIGHDGIIEDSSRPTTIKTRIISHGSQVVRVDHEVTEAIEKELSGQVIANLEAVIATVDIVLISDYGKGVISAELLKQVQEIAKKNGKGIAVDPKVEHFDIYSGPTIITPNKTEAQVGSGIEIEDDASLGLAGQKLLEKTNASAVLITKGPEGMSLFLKDKLIDIPTKAQEVFDVTGAGDTVISVAALAIAAGAGFEDAAKLSNFAASVTVGKHGVGTVTKDELRGAIDGAED